MIIRLSKAFTQSLKIPDQNSIILLHPACSMALGVVELGIILVIKGFKNFSIKKSAPKLVFFNEKKN